MSYRVLYDQQQAAGAVFAAYDGLNLAMHYGDSRAEYDAALHHAALIDTSAAGRLWLHDRDRTALLHRLSTNDIEGLQPGQGTQTVLTNHNGRIIDVLTVHVLMDQVLLVTSPQQRTGVANLLRKNIFFNDKIKLEDANASVGQLSLYGPQSEAILRTLTEAPLAELPLHHIAVDQVGDARAWITRAKPLGGMGFTLYMLADDMPLIWAALLQAGARPMGQAAYDMLRVEAGYGAYGRELSLEYIPLETGLWDAVNFKKGCYVGQEIIARMESRGRLAKQLRGVRLSAPLEVPPGQPIKLDVGGKEVGDLTSTTDSPRFGPIGLAYVRTAHAAPGTQVGFAGSDVMGEVVALPFGDG
jgi:aminomethyltransferase